MLGARRVGVTGGTAYVVGVTAILCERRVTEQHTDLLRVIRSAAFHGGDPRCGLIRVADGELRKRLRVRAHGALRKDAPALHTILAVRTEAGHISTVAGEYAVALRRVMFGGVRALVLSVRDGRAIVVVVACTDRRAVVVLVQLEARIADAVVAISTGRFEQGLASGAERLGMILEAPRCVPPALRSSVAAIPRQLHTTKSLGEPPVRRPAGVEDRLPLRIGCRRLRALRQGASLAGRNARSTSHDDYRHCDCTC